MATWNLLNADEPVLARNAINAAGGYHSTATGDGGSDDKDALASSDDAALAANLPLMLTAGTYKVSSDLTIDSPVWFTPGAVLKPDDSVTVTLAGGIYLASPAQIFDTSAGGQVIVSSSHVDLHVPGGGPFLRPSGDTTGATDRAAVENALTLRGGAFLAEGDFYLDRPLVLRSNQFVIGRGASTILHAVDTDVLGGIIFLVGQFHPNAYAAWDDDTLEAPSEGDTVLTRTTTTQTIEVGDLVMVKTDAALGHLRRVVAIDGNDVTIHKPLDGITGATSAIISTGSGYDMPFTDANDVSVTVGSYFCEHVTIANLAVDSPHAPWIARTACLESTFRDIHVVDSHGMVYGNAFTNCTFERITGNFRSRWIEIADGGRDNQIRNIVGRWTGGDDYETDDALVKLGYNDTLDGFDITDYSNRAVQLFSLSTASGWSICNGTLNIDDGAGGSLFLFGASEGGHRIDNLTINVAGTLGANIFRLANTSDSAIRNITVNNPGGRGSVYTVSVSAGVTRCLVDRITDSAGTDQFHSTGTFADCPLLNLSWRSPTTGRSTTGTSTTLGVDDQERTITLNRAGDQSVTCTDAVSYGIGTSTRLVKLNSGTLTATAGGGASVIVDPAITLPVAVNSLLTVTKLDATTFLVHH